MNDLDASQIQSILQVFVGKQCWYISPRGKFFQAYFGEVGGQPECLRKQMRLSLKAKDIAAEWYLRVYCNWRIEEDCSIRAGSQDEEGVFQRGLLLLEGCVVEGIEVSNASFDLAVRFSDRRTLRIFCDVTRNVCELENWVVFGPKKYCLVIGTNSRPSIGD